MSKSRFAWKVGLFVVLALVVFVSLVTVFVKSGGFRPKYTVRLKAETVSNLKKGSLVLMAGVPIGSVVGTQLQPGGKGVFIITRIDERFKIHSDAVFRIEQLGFLGDQY